MLETQVLNALGERTVQRIQNFFSQFFALNRWIHFDNDLPDHEVVILFLHFLIRYWPHREYGRFFQNDRFVVINCSLFKNVEMLCEYAHSSTNRMLEKMIPILEYFSQKEICLTSYEERKMAQSYFTSTIPEGFENVTFIIDATPLSIQNQRSVASSEENGV